MDLRSSTGVDLEPIQLLACDGSPRPSAGLDPAELDDELPALHALMVATRALDEEFVNLQRQGQLALFPSCRGQEAAQVGCASALRPTDWLFPQYRELGAFLVRGADAGDLGLSWRGTWPGASDLIDRCVAPICIAIGTQALHAAGAAMASTWLGDEGVTVAFIGDGATSEGDVHEAMNLAAVEAAPCLFYVQNNGWAISTPLEDQHRAASLAHRAIAYGMPGVRVDGNDVAACNLVVREAAAHARAGGGPVLIEAVTYRMGPHTTSDDPTRYRAADEVAAWAERDPIARCEAYLRRIGRWTDDLEAGARAEAARLCADLRATVFDADDGPVAEVFEHVFVEPTDLLVEQAEELELELKRTRGG